MAERQTPQIEQWVRDAGPREAVLIGRARIIAVLIAVSLLILCAAPTALAANLLYYSNQGAAPGPGISFANLDGSGGGDLNAAGATTDSAVGVAIDAATGKVYWANENNNTISYANLNGGGGGQLNITGAIADTPFGVAIDPAQGKLYWTNFSDNTDPIAYANLNGSGGGNLNITGATASSADGLAVDPATGKVYWANDNNNTISYANLAGGGGGQLNTTGVTPQGPNGVAIDASSGKLYWSNFLSNADPISFANLDGSGGGGNLSTAGATASGPFGLALDPSAGKVYWANVNNDTISYADLAGGAGGQLNITGSTPNQVGWPALLETPAAAGSPTISGGSTAGSVLSCSEGSWAPDLLESFLYRAPQSFSYQWSVGGAPIPGATSSSITASSAGSYTCSVTASNYAGPATQTSATFTVSKPSPASQVTKASIGDQQITLTTPSLSVCTANTSKLAVTLTSTRKSKGTKLKFSKAAFYIGKGVKHKHHKHGKVVITYTANATKHHVPATVDLSLAGLKPGTHTLTVVLSYKRTKREHGHKKTVTVTKTMKVKFSVC